MQGVTDRGTRPSQGRLPGYNAGMLAPRSSRRIALAGLVLAAALTPMRPASTAAPGPATSTPAAEPGASLARPLGVRFTLPNGLVVLVAERPGPPIVSVRAGVAAGAVLDPPQRAGLANVTARLLPRGTRSRTALEIDRAIELVGGSLEAGASRDGAEVELDVLRKDLDLGLDLLADLLTAPSFPQAELEKTRDEIRGSLRRSEEDPAIVAGRLLRALAFPGHPYGVPVDGTAESLGRITRDEVQGFHARTYRPDAVVVAVAGDVTAAAVRSAVSARLGAWSVPAAPTALPGAAVRGEPGATRSVQRDLVQATILLGQATIPRAHPDHYALTVATHILGGGSASRLYRTVREERGLAYSVAADYLPGRLGGLLVVDVQTDNDRVGAVLALARAEVGRLRRTPPEPVELARAKAYLTGSFPLRTVTAGQVADLLLAVEQLGLGLDYPVGFHRGITAVSGEDVLRVARAWWDPDRLSRVVVGNLRQAGIDGS